MAVVKANAYGHGLVEVARFVEKHRANYLGVAIPEEGAILREAGLRIPIHVFTLPANSQLHYYARFGLEATISSLREAKLLNAAGGRMRKTIPVHLKIETGMNRIGVPVEELHGFLKLIAPLRRLEIKGAYTHFATADERDKRYALKQLKKFELALEMLQQAQVEYELAHCANSGAILDVPQSYFSMVRPGIMLYGYYPTNQTSESIPLKPAMSLRSRVSLVKWIERGESVSYGRRFVAKRRTKIATLPLGYADGYSRVLTGQSSALLGGKEFPIVGTICMDQLMVDVGTADVEIGDEAVLLGSQGKRTITAWDLARRLQTVPYEICCGISARVPRVYKKT